MGDYRDRQRYRSDVPRPMIRVSAASYHLQALAAERHVLEMTARLLEEGYEQTSDGFVRFCSADDGAVAATDALRE